MTCEHCGKEPKRILLTVADIARERGWHRAYAHKWLRAIEKKHGTDVVWREGPKRKMVADAEALARVASQSIQDQLDQFRNRLALYDSVQRDHDLRINGVSRDLVVVRRALKERLVSRAPGKP